MNKFFFVFDEFDPVNEKLLDLVEHVSKELIINTAYLSYDNPLDKHNAFIPQEKLLLINAAVDNRQSCQYIIDGDSFKNKNWTFLDRIIDIKKRNEKSEIYWLLTSKQYNIYKEHEDFDIALGLITIILYVFPEDIECLSDSQITKNKFIFINKHKDLTDIDASIYAYDEKSFCPLVLEYINASTEVAIRRIKSIQLKDRFAHSLRVAGTIKKMCELTKVEEGNFYYKCYMSAIYHDICKNLPMKEQIYIAKSKLHMLSYPSDKILHGFVGAWYLKHHYLFQDEEILTAIREHTLPSNNASLLTKYVYLADKLELNKQTDFEPEEYNKYWELIANNKIDEAFETLKKKQDGSYEQIVYKS